jgi:predicted aldo/keto reductase-like oxidoreductase
MGLGAMQTPMFASMFEKAANCTECGECKERCPYELLIPEMIKENLDWMKNLGSK